MVINREFYFRGWLPAGLLINARLSTIPSEHGEMVCRPVLNSSPESTWPSQQPPIVFPVSQATDTKAILLKDALPEGTIAMLPLEQWYGPGTPFMLAVNTWYEGRIQEVSGEDVMAVRISKSFTLNYYSYYSGISAPDVKLATLPCKWIRGATRNCRAFKDDKSVVTELGYIPTVSTADKTVPLPIMDVKLLRTIDFAGMRLAYQSQSPSPFVHAIQCEIVAGSVTPSPDVKFYGFVGDVNPNIQNFYTVSGDSVSAKLSGTSLIMAGNVGVVSMESEDDQVIHYN